MKNAIVFTLVGLVLGGLFMNDKLSVTQAAEQSKEVVLGHRIDSNGNFSLVTKP